MKNLLKEYHQAAEREIRKWPGAAITERTRGKHCRVYLSYNGNTRFVVHPASPSDIRGVPRHVSDIKRQLALMGAKRENNA